MRILILSACALCFMACASHPGQDPAPHITPQPSEQCAAACSAMNDKLVPADAGPDVVGCEEGKPVVLKDGGQMPCVDFCVYQHDNGVAWNNDCIANQIKTCEEIETVCNK
jgi:hypothetical protein